MKKKLHWKDVQSKSGDVCLRNYWFWCPGCNQPHQINSFWAVNQETITIKPSVKVSHPGQADLEPYCCHSFITDGQIQYLGDCTHDMAGQTIELPDWELHEDGSYTKPEGK